jgi:hypothetical protein
MLEVIRQITNMNKKGTKRTPFRAAEFTCFLRCSCWSTFCVLSSGFVNHCLSLCPLFGHCIVCPSFSLDYPLTNVDDRLYMVTIGYSNVRTILSTTGSRNVRKILSTIGSSNVRKILSTIGCSNVRKILSTIGSINVRHFENLSSTVSFVHY